MNLERKTITHGVSGERLLTQMTFDDDINVSDHNADIRSIVMQTGHVRVEEVRCLGGKIRLAGHLEFSILYTSEENGMLSCIRGDFSFEETVNYDGGQDGEQVTVLCNMEDLRAQMIHSRKMNVKAIVTFALYPVCLKNIDAAVGVKEPSEVLTRTEQFAGLQVCGKDTIRVKEIFDLPGGKPDVERIIYQNVQLRNMKTRPEKGKLLVSGELCVFLLYRSVDEHMPIQWLERQIAVNGEVESLRIDDRMLSASCVQLAHTEISVQEDEDGEMRQIGVEAVLQCDLAVYEEQRVELLEDVYIPEMEFDITKPQISMTVLEGCNDSRMKTSLNMALHAQKPLVQIVYTEAAVKVEDYHPGEGGLVLEGVWMLDLLYQQADSENPFHARHEEYPFAYTVQMESGNPESQMAKGIQLQITGTVEQVNAVLSGADEAEIRLTAGFRIVYCSRKKIPVITDIEMHPVSPEKIEEMPGITGYVVKPGDTLWSIARKYYVPLSSIREVNGLTTDELKVGQKLLIVK